MLNISEPAALQIIPCRRKLGTHVDDGTVATSCIVATYNVRTLRTNAKYAKGSQLPGRVPELEKCFVNLRWTIIGLQETRQRKKGYSELQFFHSWNSAADASGNYGCSLWIHKAFLHRWQVNIVMVQPRLLWCAIEAASFRGHLFVIHAPCSSASKDEITDWWKDLTTIVKSCRPLHLPRLVLADANARVGSEPTPCLGPLFPELSNHAGTEFLAFCEATALIPLNTWVGSAGPTWFGPHGEAHRLDYVLASQQLAQRLLEVGSSHAPLASVEIKKDHWAIFATFAAMHGAVPDEYRWNLALISRELTRDPDCRDRFRQLLQAYQIPDFSTNIDLHQHDTMSFILDAAQQCFPIRASRPRSPWITESSWQWMRFRYSWRKRARLLWARARTLQLLLCFRAWQAARDLAF